MRVKVSYTINMEDVPAKVDQVVNSAEEILDSCSATLAESRCSRNNDNVVMAQIDSVRQRLKHADEILADAAGILGGYLQLRGEEPQTPEGAYAVPDVDALAHTVDKIDALQQQLMGAVEEGETE